MIESKRIDLSGRMPDIQANSQPDFDMSSGTVDPDSNLV